MVSEKTDIEWVECGRIGRAVGLKGDVAVFWNDGSCPVPEGGELFVASGSTQEHRSIKVAALREQGRLSVARFEGCDDRGAAERLRGSVLLIPADRLPALQEGEYYSYQILGLDVFLEDGTPLGKVVRIFTAGENDVYEVRGENAGREREILLPARAEIILSIDLKAERMVVRPLEGMLE